MVITSLLLGSERLLAVHRPGQDVDGGPPCRGKDLLVLFQLPIWGKLISVAPHLDSYDLPSETPPAQLLCSAGTVVPISAQEQQSKLVTHF